MIEIKEGRYMVAMWYSHANDADWMGCMFRDQGQEYFQLVYRFRHYKDEKAFDSADEKSWWTVKMIEHNGQNSTEARGVEVVETMLDKLKELGFGPWDKLEFRSDNITDNMNKLTNSKKYWLHIKTEILQ